MAPKSRAILIYGICILAFAIVLGLNSPKDASLPLLIPIFIAGQGIFLILTSWLSDEGRNKPLKDRIKSIFYSFPFLFTAILLFGFFIFLPARSVYSARQALTWPTTQATVKKANYSVKGSSIERCRIEYAYSLNGRNYVGERIGFEGIMSGVRNTDPECLVLDAKSLPQKGDFITIRYNPSKPSDAVFRANIPRRSLSSLKTTTFWFTIALAVYFYNKRKKHLKTAD